MPLLAYCVMEVAAAAEKPASGVGGIEVEELQEGGLRCLFSGLASQEAFSRLPAVEAALAFHRTLQAVLTQATVIPFRFPTLVENEEELRRDLRENGSRYAEALARLREMVQMEVRISVPEGTRAAQQPASGREYLLGRRAQAGVVANAAQKFRQATREWVEEWREHRTGEGVRCYALVRREAVAGFQEAAQALAASVPGARMSGPWPPAAFLEPEKVS